MHAETEIKDDAKEKKAPDLGQVILNFFFRLKFKAQIYCTLVTNAIPCFSLQPRKNGAR